jgi:hypothetical protein
MGEAEGGVLRTAALGRLGDDRARWRETPLCAAPTAKSFSDSLPQQRSCRPGPAFMSGRGALRCCARPRYARIVRTATTKAPTPSSKRHALATCPNAASTRAVAAPGAVELPVSGQRSRAQTQPAHRALARRHRTRPPDGSADDRDRWLCNRRAPVTSHDCTLSQALAEAGRGWELDAIVQTACRFTSACAGTDAARRRALATEGRPRSTVR